MCGRPAPAPSAAVGPATRINPRTESTPGGPSMLALRPSAPACMPPPSTTWAPPTPTPTPLPHPLASVARSLPQPPPTPRGRPAAPPRSVGPAAPGASPAAAPPRPQRVCAGFAHPTTHAPATSQLHPPSLIPPLRCPGADHPRRRPPARPTLLTRRGPAGAAAARVPPQGSHRPRLFARACRPCSHDLSTLGNPRQAPPALAAHPCAPSV